MKTTAEVGAEQLPDQALSQLLGALPPASPPASLRASISQRLAAAAPVAPLACEQAQRLISARMDGERIPEAEALEVHLANCVACTRFAAALEDQRELLRHLPVALPPEQLKEHILARIAGYQQSLLLLILTGLRRSRAVAWTAAAVTCALVFAGLGYRTQHGTPADRQPAPAARSLRTAHSTPSRSRSGSAGVRVATESPRPGPVAPLSRPSPPKRNRPRVAVASSVRVAVRPRPSTRETSAPPPASSPVVSPAPKTPAVPSPAPAEATPSAEPVAPPAVDSSRHSPPSPAVSHRNVSPPEAAETDLRGVIRADDTAVAAAESSRSTSESNTGSAPASPLTPTYVDDSPEHAPGVDAVAAVPPVSLPTAPSAVDGVQFEAPPVKTQIARKPAPPTASTAESSSPALAQIRERLRRRRETPLPVFPADDEISRTARLTVWRSGF